MISDFHLHSHFSGDSQADPRAQIEQAISLGMTHICFTDHHDYGPVHSSIDFNLDIPAYLHAMEQLRQEYADRIQLEIGIELGLQCRISDYLNRLVTEYPFDFIIGSSHFIDLEDPYFPEFFKDRTEAQAYRRYFEATCKRLSDLSCYDVVGHLDYVVRYGPNQNREYHYPDYADLLDEILKTLIAKGKGLECNTGGYKYGLGQPNPSVDILKRYRQLGGELLTVGSDAHKPAELGYYFPVLKDLLLDCGYRYYTIFHQRKPSFVKIV